MRWTLPNILTVARLGAAIALPLLFLALPRPIADVIALVLFVGASATDWFDGYYARSRKLVSRFGAMLDPIADKAMVILALLVLVRYNTVASTLVLPAAVIAFREVFVSGLREFLGSDAKRLAVTSLAKWKTTVQMVAIATLFAADAIPIGHWLRVPGWTVGGTLLWVAAGLTLVTGWDYFRKALPFLKDAT